MVVAAAAAIAGLTVADGSTVRSVWWWAALAAVVTAAPAVVTGLMDYRALRRRTRASRSINLHAPLMGTGVFLLLLVVIRAGFDGREGIGTFEGIVTLALAALLVTGAVIGALAVHVRGAGVREETLTDEAAGTRTAVAGGDR